MVKLIAAIGPNGLIGKGNKMPWHIPDEFKHFKETTMGHTLFMGGTTFNGLPKKLPNRKMVIFNVDDVKDVDKTIKTIPEAKEYLEINKNSEEIIFIAGGKFVYETFVDYAEELIISHVNTTLTGDVFLELNLEKFKKKLILKTNEFSVYRYTK